MATVKLVWTIVLVEGEPGDIQSAGNFASVDLCSGYWQIGLHCDSQPYFAFNSDGAIVMPTRMHHGALNYAAHFQQSIQPCFSETSNNIKAWLDYLLVFSTTEGGLLNLLTQLLQMCKQRRLVVSLRKSTSYTQQTTWCGRLISKDGIRYNPRRIHELLHCLPPLNTGELCEYIHALPWVSPSLPLFSRRVSPVRSLLETAYKRVGQKEKRSDSAHTVIRPRLGKATLGRFFGPTGRTQQGDYVCAL